MRKIIFFTGDQSLSGGTEKACATVLNSLSQNDHYEIELVSNFYSRSNCFFSLSSRVRFFSLFKSYALSTLKNAALFFLYPLLIFKKKPDIIVAVESINFLFFLFVIVFKPSCRLVCWEHFNVTSDLGVRRRRWARYLAARFADKIVILSDEDRHYWQSYYGVPDDKLAVIYNIAPIDFFTRCHVKKQDAQKGNVVMAAGRLEYQKGFDLLLAAWSMLDESVRSGWVLKIAGSGSQLNKLNKMAIEFGVDDSVKFLGLVKDIDDLYDEARVFVLSSRFEGFGLVLVEALAAGVPCVSFKCPAGPSDIINEGVNGVLVSPITAEHLSSALLSLLSDPSRISKMASRSQYGLERFTEGAAKARWESLFEAL